jgi:hypothetical protein
MNIGRDVICMYTTGSRCVLASQIFYMTKYDNTFMRSFAPSEGLTRNFEFLDHDDDETGEEKRRKRESTIFFSSASPPANVSPPHCADARPTL